jgi:type 2A phosphatase activator TIP41
MPRCWFVLLRFFMRVDSVMVRLREVRVFCQLDQEQQQAGANGAAGGSAAARRSCDEPSVVVVREVRHQEGTFEELRRGGAPPQGPAYADADAAAMALMAVAPVGVTKYALERACML